MSDTELTSRDYERVADASRQRLASSLDELSSSLTPGRVLDEVMSYSRKGGGPFLRGLGNSASQNPIPTLLIGAGIAMFLSGRGRVDGRHPTYSTRDRQAAHDLFEAAEDDDWQGTRRGRSTMGRIKHGISSLGAKVSGAAGRASDGATSTMSGAADHVRGAAGSAGSAMSGAASSAGSAMSSAASSAGSAMSSAAHTAGSAMSSAAERAQDAAYAGAGAVGHMASGARDSAVDAYGRARDTLGEQGERLRDGSMRLARDTSDRVSHMAQEQPLMVAAAGLAIGAAIAALLPRTRSEDSFFGETSDAVKEAVGGIASEQYGRAKSAVSHVAEDVKASAEREGLTPSAAADAVRDLGDRVSGVVKSQGESGGGGSSSPSSSSGSSSSSSSSSFSSSKGGTQF